MGNHCPVCGAVHEEDDDRACSGCAQKSSFPAQKLDNKDKWVANRARTVAHDVNVDHQSSCGVSLDKSVLNRIEMVTHMALLAAVNYESDRRKVCGESPATDAAGALGKEASDGK